jgi:hypothetical protein
MPDFDMLPPRTGSKKISVLVILSYAFDWLIMVVVGLIGYFLGNVTPNKRPFSLLDANIAYVCLYLYTYLPSPYSTCRYTFSFPYSTVTHAYAMRLGFP